MSTAYVKQKLKSARDLIGKKDYEAALQAASDVVDFEPQNYNARVFIALCQSHLDRATDSEATYRRAIELAPHQSLAWQGLATLFKDQKQWDKYTDTLLSMLDMYVESADASKCAETIEKLLEQRRERGTTEQIVETLAWLLPGSRFYSLLARLPPPDATMPESTATYYTQTAIHDSMPVLEEIIRILEKAERNRIEAEVMQRRQRLAGPVTSAEQTRRAVDREILAVSDLPRYYATLLDQHSATDESRRQTESKLLRHKHALLIALPATATVPTPDLPLSKLKRWIALKAQLRHEVLDLTRDMVLLKLPDVLAWHIQLDCRDYSDITAYDRTVLSNFADLFEDDPLTDIIRAYETSSRPHANGDERHDEPSLSSDAISDLYARSIERCQPSAICAKALTINYYAAQKEHATVIEIGEAALQGIQAIVEDYGQSMPAITAMFERQMALAYVEYDAPKHHVRALRLLDPLLLTRPDDAECLFARATIRAASEEWKDAEKSFTAVLASSSASNSLQAQAKEEQAWCRVNQSDFTTGLQGLETALSGIFDSVDTAHERLARLHWRIGSCYWRMAGDDRPAKQLAYSSFISSIKADSLFAPAFTSLGLYYLEALEPADHLRASQCFQKAFELDATQDKAAMLLAQEFASASQWDLVEVVARRVVGSSVTSDQSTRLPVGSALAKRSAWAWKAIGAADLDGKRYDSAITSFQSALRGSPRDVSTWMRLGMSYRGSGKYVAALKTFAQVLKLAPDFWQAKYCIGEVQRAIGLTRAAIDTFSELTATRSSDDSLTVVLAETRVLHSRTLFSTGYNDRAKEQLLLSIKATLAICEHDALAQQCTKILADALEAFSSCDLDDVKDTVREQVATVLAHVGMKDASDKAKVHAVDVLTTDTITHQAGRLPLSSLCAAVSVLCYQWRVTACQKEYERLGSAWYDLALSVYALRKHNTLVPTPELAKKCTEQSIMCLRLALQLEPRNALFWNALGITTIDTSAKLSQHAFIRSVELNGRSATAWTNLGLFYLLKDDPELANKALLRAQVLDPEYARAWMGQSELARANGDLSAAFVLVEHAWALPGYVSSIDLTYAEQTLGSADSLTGSDEQVSRLSSGLYAMSRHLAHQPEDATALHLHALLSERLNLLDQAQSSLEQAATVLEGLYETSESEETERRFVIAHANLGRVSLANGNLDGALTAFDAALSLLEDLPEDDEQGSALKLQAMLGQGLALHAQGDSAASYEVLQQARAEAPDQSSVSLKLDLALSKVLCEREDGASVSEATEILQGRLNVMDTGTRGVVGVVTALLELALAQKNNKLFADTLKYASAYDAETTDGLDPTGQIAQLAATFRLRQGDTQGATEILAARVHRRPYDAAGRYRLVENMMDAQVGSADEMATLLGEGERNSGNLETYLLLQSRLATLRGDTDSAIECAQRAVHEKPGCAASRAALQVAMDAQR
ncbi:uncharacterized protein L969DRAFT_96178 [Mixia osmundae IAM 14324]|uniref:Superkiller protein 3 n=1 Tax=Mixia osmundae (strain CBS 9802 / IAM 14324 / JCM 22182 / KY 12970) TaxID=764103 RepID=G7E4S6_MIXOS|nr:uncharacterized protein L969DRAFT_96178 [Mixia osmundae IAM 14324]KEI37656.1 hypothetical protein L969DRAFT_96178 [Mixia osmundae IAM 14324]GAA97836.1 hypothetical protein E5Q_04515 [Mixia osmundae IAM 14324]